jgi:hypothetical protein
MFTSPSHDPGDFSGDCPLLLPNRLAPKAVAVPTQRMIFVSSRKEVLANDLRAVRDGDGAQKKRDVPNAKCQWTGVTANRRALAGP